MGVNLSSFHLPFIFFLIFVLIPNDVLIYMLLVVLAHKVLGKKLLEEGYIGLGKTCA